MIDVIDDFLPEEEAVALEHLMLNSSAFPWYVNQGHPDRPIKDDRLGQFKFTHLWFSDHEWRGDPAVVKPMLSKLLASSVIRVKGNLQTVAPERQVGEWHSDECDPSAWTAVYYVNTCNGYTEFRDGTKVESKRGRVARFRNDIEHRSVNCDDTNCRAVINFNYCTIGGARAGEA